MFESFRDPALMFKQPKVFQTKTENDTKLASIFTLLTQAFLLKD